MVYSNDEDLMEWLRQVIPANLNGMFVDNLRIQVDQTDSGHLFVKALNDSGELQLGVFLELR